MIVLYFILYLLAGVCFGLAASRKYPTWEFLPIGLLLWVAVEAIKVGQNL